MGSEMCIRDRGMGLPLLLLGASAGKILPKSGAWLNDTKAVFGVVMLGVAVWMLSRVIPSSVTMLLLGLLLIIPSVYLQALEPLSATANGWAKLRKGFGVVLLLLGALELVGVAAGGDNLLQPLKGVFAGGATAKPTGLTFTKVANLAELQQKVQQAAAAKQPVMLDFYAEWCVACKEMEEFTFTDAEVQRQLSGYLLLQADVTENNQQDAEMLQHFGLIGPPGIIFYTAAGMELSHQRVIGFQDAVNFVKTLQAVKG